MKLPKKAFEILEFLVSHGKPENVVIYTGNQEEISKLFGYKSRQALAQHLKILREQGYIRTGRGFIEVTQKGLESMGLYKKMAFVLIKTKVGKIDEILARLRDMNITAFKVTGDRDIVAIVELAYIGEIIAIPGVEDTVSLVIIRAERG